MLLDYLKKNMDNEFDFNLAIEELVYDGVLKIGDGYYEAYMPSHHRAKKRGCRASVHLHILVMECILGRELTDEEIVHHRDENKLNCFPANLICFKSHADHSAYHKGLPKVLDEVTNTYYCPDRQPHIKNNKCKVCGKDIYETSTHCSKCNGDIMGLSYRVVERPSREELKALVRSISFVKIGKRFGVSDNAIRKWCKNYNIPYKQVELSKYSDEEWKLV